MAARRIQDRLSGLQPPALRSQGGNRAGRAVANVKQTEAMSGSAQKVRLEETLALTPALSPRRGGSTHRARKFSHPLVSRCFMGTRVNAIIRVGNEGAVRELIDQSAPESPATE